MSSRGHRRPTVAIIGSGPAGAVAAWALGKQYDVTVFEKNDSLALDGHSFLYDDFKISIPMRTFSGKYYANLFRLLGALDLEVKHHRFQYLFIADTYQYFQFFSNFHRIFPCLQNGIGLNIFAFVCYLWYTIAIFLVPPRIANLRNPKSETESFEEYTRRIWLPDAFLEWYLLPLFSSVATCSHADLRRFPAAYIADYRKGTLAAHHCTVPGMGELQDLLMEGTTKKLGTYVTSVQSMDNQVSVCYKNQGSSEGRARFDHAILATSAAAASAIHIPSSVVTSELSSCDVRVSVFPQSKEENRLCRRQRPSEILMLRTYNDHNLGLVTRSTHLHPSGAAVTVSPCPSNCAGAEINVIKPHSCVTLSRPRPAPSSHKTLLAVFRKDQVSNGGPWRNGDGNVYLAGGYASARLPLLEGCVISGLRAAEAIGAALPFSIARQTPF